MFRPYIEVESIEEAYAAAINNVISEEHRIVITENGESTWQSDPFTICITSPYKNYLHENSPYGAQFYKEYAHDLVHGKESDFAYDYHTRLFHYPKHIYDEAISQFIPDVVYSHILDEYIDQIDYIIEKLKEEPTSRRAWAFTWVPAFDTVKEDVPCLQFVQCWIDNNKLNIMCAFRSNDILSAVPANMYGLYCLQKYIRTQIGGIRLGKIWWQVHVPHIYYIRDATELSKWMKS